MYQLSHGLKFSSLNIIVPYDLISVKYATNKVRGRPGCWMPASARKRQTRGEAGILSGRVCFRKYSVSRGVRSRGRRLPE